MIVCCRQCAKEALEDLCRWLHHGGEVAVRSFLHLVICAVAAVAPPHPTDVCPHTQG